MDLKNEARAFAAALAIVLGIGALVGAIIWGARTYREAHPSIGGGAYPYTAATPTATPRSAGTLPPTFYRFFTSAQQDGWGGVQYVLWETFNPAPGVYSWTAIDAALDREHGYTVTLADGRTIAKPILFMPIAYISGKSGWTASYFYDATPAHVYQSAGITTTVGGHLVGHVLTSGGSVAVLPAYDNYTWRQAWYAALRALGAHLATRPEVVAVIASTGIDTETQSIKDWGPAWDSAVLDLQAPGVRYRFSQYVTEVLGVYREAFPYCVVLVNNAPGGAGMRQISSVTAAGLGEGLHNASLATDGDSVIGYGAGWPGMWDMMMIYSGTIPTMWESKTGMVDAEGAYWGILAGLSYRPTAMDLHPEYFDYAPSGFLAWAKRYLGQSAATTPGGWCAMKGQEFGAQSWGAGAVSGLVGDLSLYVTRTGGGALVSRSELPSGAQASIYARWARRIDPGGTMTLTVDSTLAARGWYTVGVRAYGSGALWINQDARGLDGVGWQLVTSTGAGGIIVLKAGASPVWVHLVSVELGAGASVTSAPTLAAVTSTPTATVTPTWTATATATATSTPTSTVTPTGTATITRRCYCCCCEDGR
jgi:hypothetical protein